jgi:hypothetical protein
VGPYTGLYFSACPFYRKLKAPEPVASLRPKTDALGGLMGKRSGQCADATLPLPSQRLGRTLRHPGGRGLQLLLSSTSLPTHRIPNPSEKAGLRVCDCGSVLTRGNRGTTSDVDFASPKRHADIIRALVFSPLFLPTHHATIVVP